MSQQILNFAANHILTSNHRLPTVLMIGVVGNFKIITWLPVDILLMDHCPFLSLYTNWNRSIFKFNIAADFLLRDLYFWFWATLSKFWVFFLFGVRSQVCRGANNNQTKILVEKFKINLSPTTQWPWATRRWLWWSIKLTPVKSNSCQRELRQGSGIFAH